MLTGVSLFAGIGGFDLAMQRVGIRVVASVEIDDAARRVLRNHFPESVTFADIRSVTGEQLKSVGFIPEHGVLAAGWPCQDLSRAGRRAGLSGDRSGLFWHVIRLIDEVAPRWFVLENVPGLLSSGLGPERPGGDMGVVVKALEKLGYGVAWRVLDAQYFGVPQRRRRIFFVGCFGNISGPIEVLLESPCRAVPANQSRTQGSQSRGTAGECLSGGA